MALAFFVPLIIVGGLPFTIAIYIIATIGLFEILRMKDLHLFSIPGFITWIALAVMLMPAEWNDWVYEVLGYSKIEMAFAVILILLMYTVLVKNRFTFDHVAFSILGALYVGIGFYYLIETRMFGIHYVVYALIVIWMTDTGAYIHWKKNREAKTMA